MTQRINVLLVLLVNSFFIAPSSCAKPTGDSVRFDFQGRLQPMLNCDINNGEVININFRNVAVNKIDSGIYKSSIDYRLNCGGDQLDATSTAYLTFQTSEPDLADTAAFKTSVDGLLVKVLKDGQPMILNTRLPVDLLTPPKLEALLIVEKGKKLTASPFNATGTLLAEYM